MDTLTGVRSLCQLGYAQFNLDDKVAYVMTYGHGIEMLCHGGRSLFWSQSTPSARLLPTCKHGISNYWSWSSSLVVLMLPTERRA
jgi:hypothetical protein